MEEDFENIFHLDDSTHVYINPDPEAAKPVDSFNYAESVVSSIESEFKNMPDVAAERKAHKEELSKKLSELNKKLKNTKNIKNHKMRQQNAAIAERRKKLREEIEKVKDDLFAIDQEEAGKDVSSQSLIDSSVRGSQTFNPASLITANNSNLFTGPVSNFVPKF